jgi:acyl dehydratase
MLVFDTPNALLDAKGTELGTTDWIAIEQSRIDQFADATNDHQWIHVDPNKAQTGPFGACIAHGFLTLSLANYFLPQLIDVQNISMGVNYGCDNVRFPNIVKVGSKVRGRGQILDAFVVKGGIQCVVKIEIEVEGETRPACVVDTISRYYPKTDH